MLVAILVCLYVLTGLQVTKSMTQIVNENTQWHIGWLITLGWPIVVLVVVVGVGVEVASALVRMLKKPKGVQSNGTTNNV